MVHGGTLSPRDDKLSYSSLESNSIISFAPTEDFKVSYISPFHDRLKMISAQFKIFHFKSCSSGSGVFTVKSRAYRKTFLAGVGASILQKIKGSENEGFGEGYHDFTEKKSVLVISIAAFLAYLLVGVLAYSFYFEHWTIIDSMYFTVVTFTTCGYGDLSPVGDEARLFTLFFIVIGITVLGGICLTILFENVFGAYEDMIDRAKQRSTQKFIDKSMDKIDRGVYVYAKPINQNRDAHYEPPTYSGALGSLWPFLLMIAGGAAYVGYADGWDPTTSAYFFIVTATSVGYGDVYPESQKTRLFAVLFIPCSVMVMAELFGRLIKVYLERKAHEAEEEFLNRRMTLADFNRMDIDQNGSVTYGMFM